MPALTDFRIELLVLDMDDLMLLCAGRGSVRILGCVVKRGPDTLLVFVVGLQGIFSG